MRPVEQLNIVGEYDKFQINLEGRPDALRKFVDILRKITDEQVFQLHLPDKPTIWDGYLTTIRIVFNETARSIEIKRHDTELSVIGDRMGLGNIAFVTTSLVDSTERINVHGHAHIEYPVWEEITEDSDALIVCCDARG